MTSELEISKLREEFQPVQQEIKLSKFYSFTRVLEIGTALSFVGCLFLVVNFSSPYWLVSWEDTKSPFLNLGLWTACFNLFRHPKVQFDHIYHGCYSVHGDDFRMIVYWMVPGWMILVQVLCTASLVTCLASQVCSVSLLLRFPAKFVLRFERRLLLMGGTLNLIASFLLFTALMVFSSYCWSRDYLLYPNYNYLSWSYASGLLSVITMTFASAAYFQELLSSKEREYKNKAVLYSLYPDLCIAAPPEVYSHSGSGFL